MKNILIVDDSKTVLTLLERELKEYNFIQAHYAETYHDAKKLMEGDVFYHAAILDLTLPDAQKGEIVDLADEHDIPSVVLSATMDEELRESILKKDVLDFIYKSDPSSIKFAINTILRTLKNYDVTILLVDDSALYRQTISMMLDPLQVQIMEATNGQEALDIIEENPNIQLVITDYEMPVMNGLEFTFKVREKYNKDQLAVIAISSMENQEKITKFLRFGANDFINKPFTSNEIITRVNANLEILDLFSQIKDMANKDFLTGLYNRRYFFESGTSIYKKNKRKGQDVAVAMLDIDFFKKINDDYGHDIGDLAIIEVKSILEKNLRTSDLISRFGGEEFCILLEDISEEHTHELFEKIRKKFEENVIKIDTTELQYTVSIGISYGLSANLSALITIADEALYEAKENGRNQVRIKKVSL